MFRELTESTPAVAAFVMSGTLTKEDYDQIVPLLESRIKAHGEISLYWEMEDFKGWTPSALWADTKFDVSHHDDFKRIALVGEKTWHSWMEPLMKPFTSAEVRYFDQGERETALRWVQDM